mmetsp:Transcript_2154/g.3249  ORF Transcript_2154/g.3249 Transcript_2154/m.3249 type:complete len:128 (-) Transcript_2154:102-485(-)|eukprot:CAMPEP_0175039390 /NCGR_PEP_ID=MMETSP0052_2-20121109/549_1 /TAXON_ID=51329 ORGANISM="Polytomella parva, Strain SAG 63-3" /NCGR_SAMPLE_ID=MMETSP0052_2 /ASSEMBLY_ACC=CAM_ASM_000194 /LENGTH=127 /DNA_ID=CAMNT_0016301221 /DNA_START=72 /DNA_END=455 /DNA_ORIENTATION=-
MLISKENRRIVYKYLLQEGVLEAHKDFNLPKHPHIPEASNLEVIKLMQSFKSKEFVKERFSWSHYYWFLTDKGLEFLRQYLNAPEEVVPATHKKTSRIAEPIVRADKPRGREGFGRDNYRRETPATA